MHRAVFVVSEQQKLSWLHTLLRKERKQTGPHNRVVVFVRTEAAALELHGRLRKNFPSAVNAGQHAADGIARFREGKRLVLVTPDARVPAAALLPHGAVGVSWDPPSGLPAHRARMKAAAGASTQVSNQLLTLRQIPELDPSYARALLLSMKLAGEHPPTALQEAAEQPITRPAKRQRASESLVFYHGTSAARGQLILAQGFAISENGCLGKGVYVAREDKATEFAGNCVRHGGCAGSRLKVRVTFSNAKYVRYDDTSWQAEGYDACRADRTSWSTNMEWCLKSPEQVEVLDIAPVECQQCGP